MLKALEGGNLFVFPCDDRRQWYRYHHLFAEMLRAHLMKEQPDRVPRLHQRASAWLEYNGLPEGVYSLVEATLYLATAPKSNSAGAYFKAMAKVEEEGKVQVPKHLQDGNRDARDLGHGKGYVYPRAEPGHHAGQQYLPTALLGTYFYAPSEEGYEGQVKDRLARWRAAQEAALHLTATTTPCPTCPKPKCSTSSAAPHEGQRASRLSPKVWGWRGAPSRAPTPDGLPWAYHLTVQSGVNLHIPMRALVVPGPTSSVFVLEAAFLGQPARGQLVAGLSIGDEMVKCEWVPPEVDQW